MTDFTEQLNEDIQHAEWGEQHRETWRYYDRGVYPNQPYPPIPSPSDNIVWGVDMSGYWNGVADWNVAKKTGCSFACIKACDGTQQTVNFRENVQRAKAAGMVVGAYFWLYRNIRISGKAQATAWWNTVKDLDLDFYVVDFEWTYWGGVSDCPSTNDLYGAVIPFEQLSGVKPMIYSAPGYLNQYFNHDVMWKPYPFWIAHYGVTQPAAVAPWGNDWVLWQLTDRWPGLPLGLDPAISKASDGDLFNGTQEEFAEMFGKVAEVVAHVVERPWADVEVCLTPSTMDVLPLKTPLQQAAEFGWDAAMNCGAGFEYTDYNHALVKGTSIANGIKYSEDPDFQSFYCNDLQTAIPYARKMITGGVVNPDLDTTYKAPWSMMGFGNGNIYLIVTEGQEAGAGLTQMQAANYAKTLGITDLYLFDSGHSSGIVENGEILYSAYGEAIPQCVGLKQKTVSGGSMKGVCKDGLVANIKEKNVGTLLHQMTAGEYVYGTDSFAHTDIIDFDHYYTAAGVKTMLNAVGKVSKTNLIVTNETEPVEPPPPPPSGDVYKAVIGLTVNGVALKPKSIDPDGSVVLG